jgi:hypothetical protein
MCPIVEPKIGILRDVHDVQESTWKEFVELSSSTVVMKLTVCYPDIDASP